VPFGEGIAKRAAAHRITSFAAFLQISNSEGNGMDEKANLALHYQAIVAGNVLDACFGDDVSTARQVRWFISTLDDTHLQEAIVASYRHLFEALQEYHQTLSQYMCCSCCAQDILRTRCCDSLDSRFLEFASEYAAAPPAPAMLGSQVSSTSSATSPAHHQPLALW